jgi:HNH endonuclease
MYLRKHCLKCDIVIPSDKPTNIFCSRSCANSYNNMGVRRHGKSPGVCKYCNAPKASARHIYCSTTCAGLDKRTVADPIAYKKLINREANARYRAKQKNQTPINVDKPAIKEFYANCPDGYEVDHIMPISKGGTHTIENLQYLTISENRRKWNKITRPV